MKVNFVKFGRLILRKIVKIPVTRCHIFRLKCTKFDFGSAPDSAGELTALRKIVGFKINGPTSKGMKGGDRKEREGVVGERREGE